MRDFLFDHYPAGPDREHGDEAVEQDEQYRDAVDAEQIVDVEPRDPLDGFDELHLGGAEREVKV